MKTNQNLVGLRYSSGRFKAVSNTLLLCGLLLLSVVSGWAKHIQFYNHSQDVIEAGIEFDYAQINPGDSATLYVSEGGYSLLWGPVGYGMPYNTYGEVEYEDTKISYFGADDVPRFSQYHLDNGNWVLDYSTLWTIEFQNHSQDTVELGLEFDYAVVGPGETTTVSVSGGGYSLLWGAPGYGMPYNTYGEVAYEQTKVSYFGDGDFPRFSQYHKVNGNWVLDYSTIWTIEFQNHSQDTIELGLEFDYAVVGPGETTTVSVSGGGYSLLWGAIGYGMPYNTYGEVSYEQTKVSYFGDGDFPRFSQYHKVNGNWVLDYSTIWTIEFQNHSQDTVELGLEFDYAVVGPGETTTVSVSGGGYSLLWGPLGYGMPYNTYGEVEHEETKISYFGADDVPRFTQYHKVNGNWVVDYTTIWTIEFHNQSQETVEAGLEFDYTVISQSETAILTVSGGGYSLLWGELGMGMPFNTYGEVSYEKTKVIYFGANETPQFEQYHWENNQWVLDYP